MRKIIVLVFFLKSTSLFTQTTYYVNQNVPGGLQDGSSWTNAFPDLQQALAITQPADTIWVTAGTYRPTSGNDRNASFWLISGTLLYGGFNGSESALMQRNPAINPTILSGEIGDLNQRTDNSYHVVRGKGLSNNTLIDGFTITGGYSYGEFFSLSLAGIGAGMLLEGASTSTNSQPVISNCIFERNASFAGGGLCTTWENPDSPNTGKYRVNPVLRNCAFNNNRSYNWGGAFYVNSPSASGDTLEISHCSFTGNYAYNISGGGGLYFNQTANTNVHLISCLFERDSAPLGSVGGAIYFGATQPDHTKASLVMDSCIFKKNIAAEGAGLYYAGEFSTAKDIDFYCGMTGCVFEGNKITNGGSGSAYIINSTQGGGDITVEVKSCIFKDNLAGNFTASTGGFSEGKSNILIENSLFLNNLNVYAPNQLCLAVQNGASNLTTSSRKVHVRITNCVFGKNGGGVATLIGEHNYGTTEITNCTFFDNQQYIFIKSKLPSSPEGYHNDLYLNNCVVWEPKTDDIRMFYNNDPDIYEMYGFHVENTLITVPDNFYNWPGAGEVFGEGVIYNQYPEFVDTLADDFHLLPCSVGVDAGSNMVADTFGLLTDLDGHPRILHQSVDMGAYENLGICPNVTHKIRYVNQNVSGGLQDGSSWTNAFPDLQQALAIAQPADTIWVAAGIYKPTTSNDRTISFHLISSTALYGGFKGNETALGQRDVMANLTILSGELGNPNIAFDNSLHVVRGKGLNSLTLIDGFTVRDGYTLLQTFSGLGAGMLLEGSSAQTNSRPVISNCIFENNASTAGGALSATWNDPENPTQVKHRINPVLRNCTFKHNQAYLWGGAFFVNSNSGIGDTLTISDCSFLDNSTLQGEGGALYFNQTAKTNVRLRRCLFERDTANTGVQQGSRGGSIYFVSNQADSTMASLVLDSCTFRNNIALDGSGLYYSGETNSAKETAFYCYMNHCTFDGNKAFGGDNGSVFSLKSSKSGEKITTLLTDCIFQNNLVSNFTTTIVALNNSETDARIERCIFLNNTVENDPEQNCPAIQSGAASNNTLSSKAYTLISNCVFAKNGGAVTAKSGPKDFVTTDLINCTFFENNHAVFVKNSALLSPENYRNDLNLNNCLVWEPKAARIFDNGDSTAYGFYVEHTMITVSNDFFALPGAQQVFGDQVVYNQYPVFVDTFNNNFRLLPCSPAVNAGSNVVADTFDLLIDLDGLPRIIRDTVDLGAYETQDSCIIIASQEPIPSGIVARLIPNPASPSCPLDIYVLGLSKIQWVVWDAYGRVVDNGSQQVSEDKDLSLEAPSLPGIYFIRIQERERSAWLKLVVQ